MTVFPRKLDGLGHAWGLLGAEPQEIWERFSPAYEAQAEAVLLAMERIWHVAKLAGAGGQDGEYAMASDADDVPQLLIHLEDPAVAEDIAAARKAEQLEAWLRAQAAG